MLFRSARANVCRQVDHGGILPDAVDNIDRVDRDAVLLRAVDIVNGGEAVSAASMIKRLACRAERFQRR